MADDIQRIYQTLERLDRAIRGDNGKPGLITRLTLVEKSISALETAIDKLGISLDVFAAESRAERKKLREDVEKIEDAFLPAEEIIRQACKCATEEVMRQPIAQKVITTVETKTTEKAFGTWDWFRDTYLDKPMSVIIPTVVTVILTYLLMRWIEGWFSAIP